MFVNGRLWARTAEARDREIPVKQAFAVCRSNGAARYSVLRMGLVKLQII
jgi:hypothetical protein